jgi:CRISPR/Cas system-associated protein Cas7 (RAMP superfamily)
MKKFFCSLNIDVRNKYFVYANTEEEALEKLRDGINDYLLINDGIKVIYGMEKNKKENEEEVQCIEINNYSLDSYLRK